MAKQSVHQNIPDLGLDEGDDEQPVNNSKGMPKLVRIMLEENDNIPPTGQFFGANGRSYMLMPGRAANVPMEIIDILNHAVMATAQQEPGTLRVVRMRNRLRFPYRFVNPGDAEVA